MKIYLVTNGIHRFGGTERVICQLGMELALQHDVTVLVPGTKLTAFDNNLKIVSANLNDSCGSMVSKMISRVRYFAFIKKTVPKNSLLMGFVFDINILVVLLGKIKGCRSIVCEHIHYEYHNIFRRIVRSFVYKINHNRVVCLTESDAEKFKNCGIDVDVIPNYITELSKNYLADSKLLLAVGRLVYQKNFEFLIRAFERSSLHMCGWRLKIIGEGEELEALKGLSVRLGIDAFVEILPFTNTIASEFASASVFCMTSRFEAFPMVLLEAIGNSLPVLAVDCPTGPREILNGHLSQLSRFGDISDFTEKLVNICGDVEFRKELSERNFTRAKEFSKDNVISQWIKLIDNICDIECT